MRLTGRGVAVLVLAVPTVLAGVFGGYPFLVVLGAVMLAVVLAAVLVTVRGLRVAVARSVYPERVPRGRPATASLRVSNPTERRHGGFLATDRVGSHAHTIGVRPLPPGADAHYQYQLPTAARGRLTIGPLTLHQVDPFGLAHNKVATGETATLWVHPRQLPARALVGGHPRHHHDGASTDDALRGSVDLRDIREYVPGDEVRHLHWRATARAGTLMVRDLADPQQPRLTVLLDTRSATLPPAIFEQAVDLAASLLGASALAGHHSRLVTSAGAEVTTAGGVQAARLLLDQLSDLNQDSGNALLPRELGAGKVGGCLVVVTSGGTDLGFLATLRHRFSSIVVHVLTPVAAGRTAVAGARLLRAESAEQAVRQWNEVVG